MQLDFLHKQFDSLQVLHGDRSLKSIYGTGCITKPKAMFIFMNPTARNISARKQWSGIRAPWLGTKTVWNIFHELNLLSESSLKRIQELKAEEWTANFANALYGELKENKVFVTNLAKCTQIDARLLRDSVFKNYLDLMREEVVSVDPQHIITFGNQVSSIVLGKPISVSGYRGNDSETLNIRQKTFKVYPTYYPVGQGRRNLPLAVQRIKKIIL